MKEEFSSYSLHDEALYLVGFRLNPDSADVDLYTLMTFGGEENSPIMVENKILFFSDPALMHIALKLANGKITHYETPSEEAAVIYNIPEMLNILQTSNIDETALIVDSLNILDDLMKSLQQVLPEEYKRILYPFADHLTFQHEFGKFLKERQIARSLLCHAINWLIDTVFSNSKLLSLQNLERQASQSQAIKKRRTQKSEQSATSTKTVSV